MRGLSFPNRAAKDDKGNFLQGGSLLAGYRSLPFLSKMIMIVLRLKQALKLTSRCVKSQESPVLCLNDAIAADPKLLKPLRGGFDRLSGRRKSIENFFRCPVLAEDWRCWVGADGISGAS